MPERRSERRSAAGARVCWAGAAALAALLLAPDARADTEPIRIQFTAHDGCPTRDAFTREVQARTARARLANEGEDARTFTVTITARGSASQGQLAIRAVDGTTALREVAGRACAEVVSALALITALAIDPKASTAPQAVLPPAPPTPPTPPSPPTPPPVEPFFPASAAPKGQPFVLRPDQIELGVLLPLPLPVAAMPSPRPPWRWRFSIGLSPTFIGAIAPDMSPGLSVFADATRDEPDTFAPSFRISVTRASSGNVVVEDAGQASFRWTALRFDACPLRLLGDDEVSMRACATAEGGALEGYGTVTEVRPWLSFGVLGRLQWVILDTLQLEAQGGLNLPLIQDTFFFDDPGEPANGGQKTIHEVPSAGGLVGVGVGIRFP